MDENTKQSSKGLSRLVTFIVLLGFWFTLSDKHDLFHISLGLISCFLVTLVSHNFLFEDIRAENRLGMVIRFILYLPWLIYQIILANIHVAGLVLSPKLKIDPEIVTYKSSLKTDFSLLTYGNSITLTPGTITMDIVDGEFYVHAISKKVKDDLMTGEMEARVAYVYFEGEKVKK